MCAWCRTQVFSSIGGFFCCCFVPWQGKNPSPGVLIMYLVLLASVWQHGGSVSRINWRVQLYSARTGCRQGSFSHQKHADTGSASSPLSQCLEMSLNCNSRTCQEQQIRCTIYTYIYISGHEVLEQLYIRQCSIKLAPVVHIVYCHQGFETQDWASDINNHISRLFCPSGSVNQSYNIRFYFLQHCIFNYIDVKSKTISITGKKPLLLHDFS